MDDEYYYLPDDSSTTAAGDLVDFGAKAMDYFGRMCRLKEHHDMSDRGMWPPYLLSREMLACVAGPIIRNTAVQIQNIAFGDDVETGTGGSRRCCSLYQATEEDLTQKADWLLPRQRLEEVCERLKGKHRIAEYTFQVPRVLDNITMDPEEEIADMHLFNRYPLSLCHLERMVATASGLLSECPSLAKTYKQEAAVIDAYEDFSEIYSDVFEEWDHRMRDDDYHSGSEM